jgi:mono/diheme cytochrome c family protein
MPVALDDGPRPHSMPPFVQQLDADEIAAVVNYLRRRWGGRDSALTAQDVEAMQGIVVD